MKDYYKISEISKLYGISVDSLRYYEELGVLEPQREKNNYRIYSLKDISRLNIIRDLRLLDFSMQQIKDYLDNHSVDKTLEILHEEQRLIQERINKLQQRGKMINERIKVISTNLEIKAGEFKVLKFPDRPCLQLNLRITRDEEMDFAIKKLHSKHENRIFDFANQIYASSVKADEMIVNKPVVFDSVFFILDQNEKDYDFILPKGDYLTFYYRGGYHQTSQKIFEVINYAKDNNLQLLGNPFEIYETDNRETPIEDEYLTQIQVRISK
ncbi:MerR family transcriptional regulator [Paenibacillus terrae HPL-003]|uniref:MerR family transcriptional regulator n=1 Tax=Paenibacillus terrae (strain HPL-003) TaxID=985665 RepID=G7W0J1_PAETH|nr:MerR family transcriptional regulator [Paenibacillus terrae]AET59612.1 MerR family transcriptional regulator [Paenibacillus terrae HPL-003]